MPSSPPSSARVANLLRLMHAVSHDLSNPLQALVLHATMGLEDAAPGSEQAERHQADVEATRRMRGLLRAMQGFATAGDRPRTFASMLDRFAGIFGDRFARLGVPLEVEPFAGTTEGSLLVEETLVAVGLALGARIRRAADALDTARIVVRGSGGDPALVSIELSGRAAARTAAEIASEVVPFDASVGVRARDSVVEIHVVVDGGGAA